MNVQAKVALDKEKRPERYCPAPRCLWRVVNYKGERYLTCLTGYCPRHKHLAQDVPSVTVQESF